MGKCTTIMTTASDIKKRINIGLQSQEDLIKVYGLDLTKCLIAPVKQTYRDSVKPSEVYELWTVPEETEDRNGHKIYFDSETNMFGLAVKSDKDELIDIGIYGTFLETLYSM